MTRPLLSILANKLENIFCGRLDSTKYDKVIIDISDFDPDTWQQLAEGIVYYHYIGSGTAKWYLTDTGIIVILFEYWTNRLVKGDVALVHAGLFDQVLTIHIKANKPMHKYISKLGVTKDGMWLDFPRRYYDDPDDDNVTFDWSEMDAFVLVPTNNNVYNTIVYDEAYMTERMARF